MLGVIALILFFFILFASTRRWIPQDVLPLQSVLVLGALFLFVLAVIFRQPFHPAQLFAATTFHPITATIAGFLLAGAVKAAGGFAATSRVLFKMGGGFFGISGVVVLLVNIPTIFAMPCGRVWAAALIPVAVMFSSDLARQRNNPSLVPIVVFGLIINAAASCGPSPLGGIGMMGEGTAGFYPHIFSNPLQLAIMVITLVAMVAVSGFAKLSVISINPQIIAHQNAIPQKLPAVAYFAFVLYMVGLAVIFITQPPVPVQTLLLGITILVMIAGRVSLKELIGGVIFHPVTAMVAGFIMAGALLVTGGFDTLSHVLIWLATHTPLGFIGTSVILIFLPTIFPMPCGRIVAAALLPGVIMFGQVVSKSTGNPQCLPVILVAFILCSAASCGPSSLGGIGGIGEGNLMLRSGAAAKPLQISVLLGVPAAALIVSCLGLSREFLRLNESSLALSLGVVFGITVNMLLGDKAYTPGGILGGILVGGLILVL